MKGEILEKLKGLKVSDIIFIIFIIISISGIYANHLERKELNGKDNDGKEKAHNIRLILLVVGLLIYLYFLQDKVRNKSDEVSAFINNLDILASILFVIGGCLFLYVEYKGEDDAIILE